MTSRTGAATDSSTSCQFSSAFGTPNLHDEDGRNMLALVLLRLSFCRAPKESAATPYCQNAVDQTPAPSRTHATRISRVKLSDPQNESLPELLDHTVLARRRSLVRGSMSRFMRDGLALKLITCPTSKLAVILCSDDRRVRAAVSRERKNARSSCPLGDRAIQRSSRQLHFGPAGELALGMDGVGPRRQ